ncbi:MAG: hypothetical protein ORN85_09310 [Sediminibacterium sp.]|nr:hypothetical protein [Sediminibacterium sp.]
MSAIRTTQQFLESIMNDLEKKGKFTKEDKAEFQDRYFNLPPPNPFQNALKSGPLVPTERPNTLKPMYQFPKNDAIISHRHKEIINSLFLAIQLDFQKKFTESEKDLIKYEFLGFYQNLVENFKEQGY